jgi:hypothetical protein
MTDLDTDFKRKGDGAKRLGEAQPVVPLRWFGEDGELAGRGPVEFTYICVVRYIPIGGYRKLCYVPPSCCSVAYVKRE